MIELVESKELVWIFSQIETLKERTKNHTIQIHELQKELKDGKRN